MTKQRIRVLIIDDSAIVRKVLSDALAAEEDLEVVGTAPDAIIAREKIDRLKPDVLTLDIEMPRVDGLTFLKQLMREHPMPVVVISSLGQSSSRIALEALQTGAVEVLAKPGGPYSVGDLMSRLPRTIRAAASASIARIVPAPAPLKRLNLSCFVSDPNAVIAIGASTGGTEALRQILVDLPANAPAIVIVQHIPAVFSKAFADRLDGCCKMHIKEAANGDEIRQGVVLIAPGNYHLTIARSTVGYHAEIGSGPLVCYQRPSVDVLFESVAQQAARHATGVLLTGMGNDGAQGLLQMKQAGARTIAQDEASSVVFGMPREAIRLGAAGEVVALGNIARSLVQPRAKVA